jgi:hypothetical protein
LGLDAEVVLVEGEVVPPAPNGSASVWILVSTVSDEDLPDPTDAESAPLDEPVDDVDADVPDDDTPTAQQALRYYGVDFDVEGLVRRFERGDLTVPSFDPAADTDGEVEQGHGKVVKWCYDLVFRDNG